MNKLLNSLQNDANYTYTENGALTHKSTNSALLDMFGMGGAYRSRSDADVVFLFKKAFEENETYALKCLFYLRDILEGQGERRFFRTCMTWLANEHTDAAKRNISYIPMFGRWDDLYCFVGTKLEKDALQVMRDQLELDVQSKTPSLLAKWMKSENTSSAESRRLANITRIFLGMNHKQYRKTLAILRERINVLERLMSAGKWDEIEFDKIPSKAGMIYRNAFARHDVERMKATKEVQSYADFVKDETKTVNAKALYPYEVVSQAVNLTNQHRGWWGNPSDLALDDVNRLAINKYWDNLKDYFNGATFNGLAVVDTSGSMTGAQTSAPINVAISLGIYCAERANGPFKDHYISFASEPQLIKVEGVDFVDKVERIYKTNLIDNTNIEATFDLILNKAINNRLSQDDLPQNIIIISDMEFDSAVAYDSNYRRIRMTSSNDNARQTLMEGIAKKWQRAGYTMPNLVFWNVDARQDNIPMKVQNGITFVSGMSPVIFEMIMKGKTGYDLMMDKLNDKRYNAIR